MILFDQHSGLGSGFITQSAVADLVKTDRYSRQIVDPFRIGSGSQSGILNDDIDSFERLAGLGVVYLPPDRAGRNRQQLRREQQEKAEEVKHPERVR